MKIVGVVCSPRVGGNTEIMVREALGAAQTLGAETELVHFGSLPISPCNGCESCETTGKCSIDDEMQDIYPKLEAADGIIIGCPVYFVSVAAQAKIFMDRTYALMHDKRLKGKVGAAIVTSRRTGAAVALGTLYSFFVAQRMLIAGGAIGYGRRIGDVRHGTGGVRDSGLEEARAAAKNLVRLLE